MTDQTTATGNELKYYHYKIMDNLIPFAIRLIMQINAEEGNKSTNSQESYSRHSIETIQ